MFISGSQLKSSKIISFTTNDQRVAIRKNQLPATRQRAMFTNEVMEKDRARVSSCSN